MTELNPPAPQSQIHEIRIDIDATDLPELIPENVKEIRSEFDTRSQFVSDTVRELGGAVIQRAWVHMNVTVSVPHEGIEDHRQAIKDTPYVARVYPSRPTNPRSV